MFDGLRWGYRGAWKDARLFGLHIGTDEPSLVVQIGIRYRTRLFARYGAGKNNCFFRCEDILLGTASHGNLLGSAAITSCQVFFAAGANLPYIAG